MSTQKKPSERIIYVGPPGVAAARARHCSSCSCALEPFDFQWIASIAFLWGASQTILFRSGMFYGNATGYQWFRERYPNGILMFPVAAA